MTFQKLPFLTVCMVTFNSAEVLGKNLIALKNAVRYANITCELRVVDNNSSDNSVEIVQRLWPDAKIYRNSVNKGYAAAINQATSDTSSDWLLFLNPDTIVPPNLFVLLKHVNKTPNVCIFSPALANKEGNIKKTAYKWPTLTKELVRLFGFEQLAKKLIVKADYLLPERGKVNFPDLIGEGIVVDYVAGAALFIKGRAWKNVGPFDENFFLYHEEMEWCYRASKYGYKVFVFPNYKVFHYSEHSSKKRPKEIIFWQYKGLLHFYEKHRSVILRLILRFALMVSFGFRAVRAASVKNKEDAEVFMKVAKLAFRK